MIHSDEVSGIRGEAVLPASRVPWAREPLWGLPEAPTTVVQAQQIPSLAFIRVHHRFQFLFFNSYTAAIRVVAVP